MIRTRQLFLAGATILSLAASLFSQEAPLGSISDMSERSARRSKV